MLDRVADLEAIEAAPVGLAVQPTGKLNRGAEAFVEQQALVRGERCLTFRRPAQHGEPERNRQR